MSEFVDNILSYNIKEYKNKFKNFIRDDRVKLATLVSLYSNNQKSDILKKFINEALYEDTQCYISCTTFDPKCKIENLREYAHFREKLNNLYIHNEEQKDSIVQILYFIKYLG